MSRKKEQKTTKVKKSSTYRKKLLYAVLLIILGVGFYLRIGGVLTNSFAFTYDVGRDLLQVQNIFETHKVPLIGQTTGLGGLYYGPWWYYILTPAFIVSQGNPQGIAFYMVLIGVLCILLGYVLGVILNSRKLGLIIASLISVSSIMIGFSNQIWNPNIAPTLVVSVLIIIFYMQKRVKNNFTLYVFLGFLLGLILDAEIVFGVLFIIGIAFVLLYLYRKNIINRYFPGLILGFFITISPRLFFELRHGFVMTKSLFQMHGGDQKILDFKNFFLILPDRLLTLIGQMKEAIGFESQAVFYIVLILIIGMGIFSRKNLQRSEKHMLVSLGIVFLTFLIGSSLFARAVWGHYLVGLPVLYIIFISILLASITRKNVFFGAVILFFLVYVNVKPFQLFSDLKKPLWEGNAAVYRNQLTAVDYVYKDSHNKDFNFIAYTPAVHDYTYRYLFSWYGKKTYGRIPSVKKEELFYLIIEPDPGYEGRIKDWLKVREGDGKIISNNIVKGGITVQKRIH